MTDNETDKPTAKIVDLVEERRKTWELIEAIFSTPVPPSQNPEPYLYTDEEYEAIFGPIQEETPKPELKIIPGGKQSLSDPA